MQKLLIILTTGTLVSCGFLEHHEHEVVHHGGAHSYQNIHMEHFHPVPTYVKKVDEHLLKHPISLGQSSSKLEVHHGGKHDPGYAHASVENDLHDLHTHVGGFDFEQGGHDDFGAFSAADHQEESSGYQVQDQGGEFTHQQQVEQSTASHQEHAGFQGGHLGQQVQLLQEPEAQGYYANYDQKESVVPITYQHQEEAR